ncbi:MULTISPECIES: DUF6366 family protein [unclassified Lysinibacillus]|uniref:DUF6366 family protein n=1 Tax=unclassified Lysinibacillus TaxID=2636778 RepID=UPI002557763B|nr:MULTISPECIES: DUF6366 family protein [unclassified Lysinibacillus]MDM5248232.1 DUF6366 family protein [Lysinibacillus sp. G4S2]
MDSKEKETPEEKRERLRQSELKNNPTGSLNDGVNRGIGGNLAGMGWKDTVVLILVLFIGYIVYKLINR